MKAKTLNLGNVPTVQDVSFEVEKNGKISSVSATKEQMDSINAYTKAEYERFLAANKNEPELD